MYEYVLQLLSSTLNLLPTHLLDGWCVTSLNKRFWLSRLCCMSILYTVCLSLFPSVFSSFGLTGGVCVCMSMYVCSTYV